MTLLTTAAPTAAGDTTTSQPEFIRLPRVGLCHFTGLSRSKLNQLILPCSQNGNNPPVKSLCLRPNGALKGTRLIPLQSLIDYLYSQMDSVQAGGSNE